MDRPRQLLGEQRVDTPLASNTIFAGKNRGNHFDVEVAFSLGTRTGMAGMPVGLVADLKPRRLQTGGEFFSDTLGNAHAGKS